MHKSKATINYSEYSDNEMPGFIDKGLSEGFNKKTKIKESGGGL